MERVLGETNLPMHERPNEPRRSPPGGNDPCPHGSLDLKGRPHLETGFDRICRWEIESWFLFWSVFYGLLGVGASKRWNGNIFRFPLQIQREQNNKKAPGQARSLTSGVTLIHFAIDLVSEVWNICLVPHLNMVLKPIAEKRK
jgi:hypothetical protein